MISQSGFPSTLQPAQPKREVGRDQILGGPVGFIDEILKDTVEYIAGTPVNEARVQRTDLEQLGQWKEYASQRFEGSMTGFNMPKTRESNDPELRMKQLQGELTAAHNYEVSHVSVEEKRGEVNKRLGFNENYRVPINEDGDYSGEYYKAEDERKNSKLTEAELKANREKQVAQARGRATPGFQMRQGELDMGKERAGGGHFTTAPG